MNNLLGEKHKGLRISASGLLDRIAKGKKVDTGDRFMLGELLRHMEEIGTRYYSGDIRVVDEFLQLYCLDRKRPDR